MSNAASLVDHLGGDAKLRRGGHYRSTSMMACANASGASCGRLCPTPPVTTRCAYLPTNLPAYALASGCGAPLASPSSVIVGTLIAGPGASRRSSSSYDGSPSASPAASDSCG
jgi:hypothetical protein